MNSGIDLRLYFIYLRDNLKQHTMAFLLVEKPIDQVISGLQYDKTAFEKSYAKQQDETIFSKLKNTLDKLRCAEMYQTVLAKRNEYDKFKYLKWKNPEEYIRLCRAYVKDIKGIDFAKREMKFRVRIRKDRGEMYLGMYNSPLDAIDVLKVYVYG